MKPDHAVAAPAPPKAAAEIFGERLPLAVRYTELLASTGTTHGLIGPRESPKLWERHLLNCAVMESLLPHRCRLLDIGTGAGLPGVVLAIARPDLQITLVEPLQRRVDWLYETITELGLTQVTIQRGRAEQLAGRIQAPVVTARAVAPLDRLVHWSWPLLPVGGRLLALKGESAEAELRATRPALEPLGVYSAQVLEVGAGTIRPPARVIEVVRGATPAGLPAEDVRRRHWDARAHRSGHRGRR